MAVVFATAVVTLWTGLTRRPSAVRAGLATGLIAVISGLNLIVSGVLGDGPSHGWIVAIGYPLAGAVLALASAALTSGATKADASPF